MLCQTVGFDKSHNAETSRDGRQRHSENNCCGGEDEMVEPLLAVTICGNVVSANTGCEAVCVVVS